MDYSLSEKTNKQIGLSFSNSNTTESMNTDQIDISNKNLKKNFKSASNKSIYKALGLNEYYKDEVYFKLLFHQEAEKIVSKFNKKDIIFLCGNLEQYANFAVLFFINRNVNLK